MRYTTPLRQLSGGVMVIRLPRRLQVLDVVPHLIGIENLPRQH